VRKCRVSCFTRNYKYQYYKIIFYVTVYFHSNEIKQKLCFYASYKINNNIQILIVLN
jgi:hypothetical protein